VERGVLDEGDYGHGRLASPGYATLATLSSPSVERRVLDEGDYGHGRLDSPGYATLATLSSPSVERGVLEMVFYFCARLFNMFFKPSFLRSRREREVGRSLDRVSFSLG
jgi:hypothetical protein